VLEQSYIIHMPLLMVTNTFDQRENTIEFSFQHLPVLSVYLYLLFLTFSDGDTQDNNSIKQAKN